MKVLETVLSHLKLLWQLSRLIPSKSSKSQASQINTVYLQMIQILVQKWKIFLKLWFSAVAVQILFYQYFNNEDKTQHLGISRDIDHFQVNWCRVRRARVDLDSLLRPCFYNISWNGASPNRQQQTDAAKSIISFFDIRPAGQFSRPSIQTKTRDGKLKLIGGDSWRVLLRGPATVSPTAFWLIRRCRRRTISLPSVTRAPYWGKRSLLCHAPYCLKKKS